MSPLCLILSADACSAAELLNDLSKAGVKPYRVDSLQHALAFMRQWSVDAIVVDADSLRELWHKAVAELRLHSEAPVLMLSSSGDDLHQIAALNAGATAVAVKPISTRLIVGQLQSLIRWQKPVAGKEARSVIEVGSLRLDPRRIRLSFGEDPLSVTSAEFELLFLLASRLDDFVHRAVICATLRIMTGTGHTSRSADMHVCRLRRKLDTAGVTCAQIDTIYGRGYSLRRSKEPRGEPYASPKIQWSV